MIARAPSIAPLQSLIQPGRAHSVSTSAKPASLPPTEMVTRPVEPVRALTWEPMTSGMVAPEQARKLSACPPAAAIRLG